MRRVVLLGLAIGALALVVALPSWAQDAVEPAGELTQAQCYGHHKTEGFRSMDLFPTPLHEVPKGQPFEVQLTVRNPWLADLENVFAFVNITDASGLSFPGERDPVALAKEGKLGDGANQVFAIPVDANATAMVVSMDGASAPLGTSEFRLAVDSPDGAVHEDDGAMTKDPVIRQGHTSSTLHLDQSNLTRAGLGGWRATVSRRGLGEASFALRATVYYNLSRSSELVVQGPPLLKSGESFTFHFSILAKDVESLNSLRYGGRANAHHIHNDRSIENDGDYEKWNTMQFSTGATLQVGSANVDSRGVNLLEPVLRRWGEVLGFAGSFLVIPSLVFGGTFGKRTVEPLNKYFGGARRRVLFHNSMSFWLLGIATLHMLVFFYEAFWSWSHGLVWGGLALASMIGLGVTGATQRNFVARWGFMRWRFVHFAMGILVFVFVLIHLVADGPHLAAIRGWFG